MQIALLTQQAFKAPDGLGEAGIRGHTMAAEVEAGRKDTH